MKEERKKDRGLKKRQTKNQTLENRRVTMHEQPIKKMTCDKNWTKKVVHHKCNINRIWSYMAEYNIFLKNCPFLDKQFRNKGATNEPENISSK